MDYFNAAKAGQSTAKQNLIADIEKQKETEALKILSKERKLLRFLSNG